MSRTRAHQIVSAAALALLLAACVPEEPQRQSLDDLVAEVEAANAAADADSHDHDDHDHGEGTEGPGGEWSEQPSEDSAEATEEATTEAAPAPLTDEPTSKPAARENSDEHAPPVMEQHDDFPMTATLSATCVEQGAEITIEVDASEKNTGVVYLAYYAGGESGAPPPYGDGHGGNSGDLTDDDGHYEDSWVVSATAPVGPARVEVMAGRNNGEPEKSTAVVRFEVVGAGSGGCDR